MKKSSLFLSLVGVSLLGSIASATALSSITPNVVSVTTAAPVTLTAAYNSQWVLTPADDMYLNTLNSATPNTNYPVITSTNTYDLTIGRSQQFIVKGKNGTANLRVEPKNAYATAR